MRDGRGLQANGVAFVSLVCGQLLHALSCRDEERTMFDEQKKERNIYLDAALGGSFGLQAVCAALPAMRGLLGIPRFGLLDAAVVCASGVATLLLNETCKKNTPGKECSTSLPSQL